MATTQNTPLTPVLIGGTLSTSIKSAYLDQIAETSKATGLTLDWILDRAIGWWLKCEAPVHIDHAKGVYDQKA
jgi:hypothetical protein